MNISAYLDSATAQLRTAGIESARLDVLILLEAALDKDRSWILAHPEHEIDTAQLSGLEFSIARRLRHEPIAYILGTAEFYGRTFLVNPTVLIPRPETESFVSLLKSHKLNKNFTHILDVGTGSGCLGITLALELPHASVTLTDIDAHALHLARKNAEALEADVDFMRTDLLNKITVQADIIATNLPYVPNNYPVLPPVSFEPKQALYAGADGMDTYRRFWAQLTGWFQKPALVLTEALLEQHDIQTKLAASAGYCLDATEGLVQLFTPRI